MIVQSDYRKTIVQSANTSISPFNENHLKLVIRYEQPIEWDLNDKGSIMILVYRLKEMKLSYS